MADVHEQGPLDAPASPPVDGHEHDEVDRALDGIEAALDEVAATIARMT